MNRRKILGWLILIHVGLSHGLMAAPTDRYEELTGEDDDFDAIEKTWREAGLKIADFPAQNAWKQLQIDNLPEGFSLFLDIPGMSVSKQDYVTRYWIKLRSGSGSESIAFEGLRCSTKEYLVYAYGHEAREQKVTPVKLPKWQKLGLRKKGNYREELARYYLCAGTLPKTLKQVDQRIRGSYELNNPYEEDVDL